MKDIATLGVEEAARLTGVAFDLDDTVLTAGALSERAYGAFFRLRESGLALLAVTGRPLGWAEVLARQWPVEAVVAENGAVAARRDGVSVRVLDPLSAPARSLRAAAVRQLADELRQAFPELTYADDVGARRTDLTLDVGERRSVTPGVVRAARELAELRGFRTHLSSVHLHVTLDADDKASGAVRLLASHLGLDATRALSAFAFVGDSENDGSCFAAFHTTIGVANLRGRPTVAPRYGTTLAAGEGFAEAAAVLVARRAEAAGR